MVVESKPALSGTIRVDSATTVTRTSRRASRTGSNTLVSTFRPSLKAPPNARRKGSSVVSTIGWRSVRRVVWESPAYVSVIRSTESPWTCPRATRWPSSAS